MKYALATFAILLAGCQSMTVHKASTLQKGVPFYVKTSKVKQVTQYSRSWIEVQLDYAVLDPASGKQSGKQSVIFLADPNKFEPQDAYAAYGQALTEVDNGFRAVEQEFRSEFSTQCKCDLSHSQLLTQTDSTAGSWPNLKQTLISNDTSVVTVVDYDHLYYFNSKVPPFGTSSATIKLAGDGTLTEASSTVDTTKLADLIPLKELLVDRLGLAAPAPGGAPALGVGATVGTLAMSVRTNGYHYRVTKIHQKGTSLNQDPLDITNNKTIVRSEFGSSSAKAESSDAIKISGTVQLPKQ